MPKTILEKERDALLDSYAGEVSGLCQRLNALERSSCDTEKESDDLYVGLGKRLKAISGDDGVVFKKVLKGLK